MSLAANIIVIDDDASLREGCMQTLAEDGHRVQTAADGVIGLQMAAQESFDVVVLDLKMPKLDGMQVLFKLKEESPHTAVVVMTGYATVETAVEAMRRGACDYIAKPFTPDLLSTVVRRAVDNKRLALENLGLKTALREHAGRRVLVGQSPPMQKLAAVVAKVAPTDATVLLVGETGVGKEVVARTIHQQSDRADMPFITVDCAALVENLFESEMFGHVRGAYTGAIETTIGKFELANGGSTRRIRIDVRIIAATNNDLLQDIRDGSFREDLFFRLSVVPIRVPALRDRGDDIALLANHFLQRHRAKRNPQVQGFSADAMQMLRAYAWPGNVRELENTVERALVMAEGNSIDADDLFFYGPVRTSEPPALESDSGGLAAAERREIEKALQATGWQMTRAAEELGINRKTLREKIRRHGIQRPPS
jgi:two-component system response regulator HydG